MENENDNGSLRRKAGELARDREKLVKVLRAAEAKASDQDDSLRHRIRALVRMLMAWLRGEYDVPWASVVLAVFALVYFIVPMDASPDFLPMVGLVDDAAVVAMVLAAIGQDVKAFVAWERKRGSEEP